MDLKKSPLDALHGWLVLAPLAVLCAPPGYSLFDGAPDTTSIGVGVSVLGIVPALLMALLRGRGDRSLPVLLLWIAGISAAILLPRFSDSFGAWRSLAALAAAGGFAVSAGSLGPSGRRVLQRGLGALAVLLLATSPMGPLWTGALGNTGDLSEAALPCAILGAGTFLTATGILAFIGFAGVLMFALYSGFVPAYAGLVSLGAVVLVAGFGSVAGRNGGESGRKGAAKRLRILLVALLLGLTPVAVRTFGPELGGNSVPATEATEQTGASADDPSQAGISAETAAEPPAGSTTGGFEFRRLTWARLPQVLEAHPIHGVGPGQFQAAFPPFRDPAEIQLSSFGRQEPTPIAVEHPHNDWFNAIVEHGPIGGGAIVLFLLIMLWRGARATWGGDSTQRDFGLAAVALLVNALFNSPLFYGPAAPAIAFAVFGVVGAPAILNPGTVDDEDTAIGGGRRVLRYLVPAISLAAVGLVASRALMLVEYGRALAETPSAAVRMANGAERLDATKLGAILGRAAIAAPDSPVVLEKKAQLLSRTGAPLEQQRAVLESWNTVRPHSFAGSLAMGVFHAKKGEFDEASANFERARSLDERNPLALQNLLRAACDRRDAARVEEALNDLEEAQLLTPEYLRSVGTEMLLGGRLEVAAPIIARMTEKGAAAEPADGVLRLEGIEETEVDVLDANSTYVARNAARAAGDKLLEDAYNVAYQLVIALDHLEHGLPAQAAVSSHQALQAARGRGIDIGPIRLRKAAAKAAAGIADGLIQQELLDEARAILEEAPIRTEDRAALTQIEQERLRAAGLLQEQ
jgi:O-antigen ligase/tetratricopeptide (TPR) repeat protein